MVAFKNKTVVITAGNRGGGLALSQKYVENGANVVMIADKSDLMTPHVVSTNCASSNKKGSDQVNLIEFVGRCCQGFAVTAQQVIDNLLSTEDEQDIINGNTPEISLRLHIELWIKNGMPYYSGKPN